jgi:hypothetical protein
LFRAWGASRGESDTLAAGRKRARIRPLWFMGAFFRGQNKAAALLRAAAASDDEEGDNH